MGLLGRRLCRRLLPSTTRRSAQLGDLPQASFAAGVGLFAERRPAALFIRRVGWSRAQGAVLAVSYWFWLRMCFLGDAHAGVSCRLQVGAPRLLPSTTRRSIPPAECRLANLRSYVVGCDGFGYSYLSTNQLALALSAGEVGW